MKQVNCTISVVLLSFGPSKFILQKKKKFLVDPGTLPRPTIPLDCQGFTALHCTAVGLSDELIPCRGPERLDLPTLTPVL